MDWLITFGAMSFIVMAGVIESGMRSGFFHQNATEPFISQQSLDAGVYLGLASVVPFWREHPLIGAVMAALAGLSFAQGLWGLWQYSRRSKTTE